jgi:hypothetical protein
MRLLRGTMERPSQTERRFNVWVAHRSQGYRPTERPLSLPLGKELRVDEFVIALHAFPPCHVLEGVGVWSR